MTLPTDVAATNADQTNNAPRPWRRLQFGLAGLFVVISLMAVGIVLLKNFGHWGLVAITAAAFVFTGYVFKQRKEGLEPSVDLVWGIGLPVLCFLYDPGLFRDVHGMSTFGQNIFCLALSQMTLFFAWVLIGPRATAWNAFLAGALIFGLILSGAIGVLLLPFALICSIVVGMGLPGFIPSMTAYVFHRNWRQIELSLAGKELGREIGPAATLGFLSAIFVPIALVAVLHSFDIAIDLPKVSTAPTFLFDD